MALPHRTRRHAPPPPTGVPPTETPPAESGISGISYPEPELRRGWAALPLTLIMLVVALVAVGLVAMIVELIR